MKELPPVTPLGTNRRGISKAAHGAALLSELSSTEEPGCSELLRPAVCSFKNQDTLPEKDWRAVLPPIIAGVPRRTEVPGTSFSALSKGTWHRRTTEHELNRASQQQQLQKIGEPFFQSLSAFASDPRRRANAPVNTYSALQRGPGTA